MRQYYRTQREEQCQTCLLHAQQQREEEMEEQCQARLFDQSQHAQQQLEQETEEQQERCLQSNRETGAYMHAGPTLTLSWTLEQICSGTWECFNRLEHQTKYSKTIE